MPIGKNPRPRKKSQSSKNYSYFFDENIVILPQPGDKVVVSFFDVINARKSERFFSELSLYQISNLLWYSAKVKDAFAVENGNILTHRNSPSAGAIHPIDILVSLSSPLKERVLYYYNPFEHKLIKLKFNPLLLHKFFVHVSSNLKLDNGMLVWFVAHIKRTQAAYINPESLVWKDAGALIMMFQLVATAFDIKSCPVGTLGEPILSEMFGGAKLISAGGMLVGQ
jgi:SagB-type dehydrogenase family enzyme